MRILRSAGNVSFLAEGIEHRLGPAIRAACHRFSTYRNFFGRQGLRLDELSDLDLVTALVSLTPLTKADYRALQQESFEQQSSSPFMIDTSSGSTSKPVLKFTSPRDEEAELEAAVKAFRSLGLSEKDRVVCLDIGASEIYLFYGRALYECGVHETSFVSVTPDYKIAVHKVARLNPTVIISVPSVLLHLVDSPTAVHESMRASSLTTIVYIGEHMDDHLREQIRLKWGASSFSFYGTTEVGSVGMECSEHAGIHVPLELFVPTLTPWLKQSTTHEPYETAFEGAIAWTSVRMQDQPVLMYAVNDLVQIDPTPCGCGLSSPRMRFLQRTDDSFSIFGLTYTYDVFREAIQRALGASPNLELCLEIGALRREERQADRLTLTLPDAFYPFQQSLQKSVLEIYPLSSLVSCGFLEVALRFARRDYFHRRKSRKVRIVDHNKVFLRDAGSGLAST